MCAGEEKTLLKQNSQETAGSVCAQCPACLAVRRIGRRREGGAMGKGTHRSDWVIFSFHSPSFSEVFT